MDPEVYSEELQKSISSLPIDKLRYFAWINAIRALPFLAIRRFDYWQEKKQTHLANVFRTLDIVRIYSSDLLNSHVVRKEIDASFAKLGADLFNSSGDIIGPVNSAIRTALFAVQNAYGTCIPDDKSKVTLYAANTATATTLAVLTRAEIIADAVIQKNKNNESEYALFLAKRESFVYNQQKLYRSILSEDIRRIRENDIPSIRGENELRSSYQDKLWGEIWEMFISALWHNGCGYWADTYTALFSDGFRIDEDELVRRCITPNEIWAEGAKTASDYLLGQSSQSTLPSVNEKQQKSNMTLTSSGKIEISIPIIPGFVALKKEISLDRKLRTPDDL